MMTSNLSASIFANKECNRQNTKIGHFPFNKRLHLTVFETRYILRMLPNVNGVPRQDVKQTLHLVVLLVAQ